MKALIDVHTHTIVSGHAYSTVKENIDKMLDGKDYSRIDIHFELSVIDANNATVSVRYIALP